MISRVRLPIGRYRRRGRYVTDQRRRRRHFIPVVADGSVTRRPDAGNYTRRYFHGLIDEFIC